ncbi:MAG: MmgE/PrpD family protein, partial [Ilumatobacteraceae bacterium]
MASVTGHLVDWATSVSWSTLPPSVRRATTCRTLDSIGLMLAGSDTAAGRAVREHVLANGGVEQATLLGHGRRLPASSVALAHGTWAHVHDFDDTEPSTVVHPTSPIVAAALAGGEAHDA